LRERIEKLQKNKTDHPNLSIVSLFLSEIHVTVCIILFKPLPKSTRAIARLVMK